MRSLRMRDHAGMKVGSGEEIDVMNIIRFLSNAGVIAKPKDCLISDINKMKCVKCAGILPRKNGNKST